jgi:sugar transferase (PEP-CTERM system associated)
MSTITTDFASSVPAPAPAPWRIGGPGTVGAWRCFIVRADGFLVRAELLLLAFAASIAWTAHGARGIGAASTLAGAGALLVACRLAFYAGGVHRLLTARWMPFLAACTRSTVWALVATGVLFLAVPSVAPGTWWASLIVVASLGTNLLMRLSLTALVQRRVLVDECLILGRSEKAERFFQELLGSEGGCVRPIPDDGGACVLEVGRVREMAVRGPLSLIVLADSMERQPEVQSLLVDCKLRGIAVEDAIDSYERLAGKIWVEGLRPDWLIYSRGFRQHSGSLVAKRALDLAAAVALLLIAAPVMLLLAAAIRLESPGPALFAQERVGQHGTTFTLYKFRSMRQDAEAASGPVWAGEADSRITPLGRLVRKCRLDELPQIWNVLRGEMSFVGPRPERPYFVDLLKQQIPFYDLRHYVPPGITGWAQVKYPYGASIEDACQKLQYDLYYSKHMSFWFDVVILLKTIQVVLMGRGAR